MSLSIQKMVSDGTLSTIVLGVQYLQRNDIYMRIDGVETPQSGAPSGYTWSFLDNSTIRVLPVVPTGVEVVVYRRTDLDAMYNVYSQNAQFDESTIDENNQQLLFIAQEYFEQAVTAKGIANVEHVSEDDLNVYYRFVLADGTYTNTFAIPKPANSSDDASVEEALRRSYANAGLTVKGYTKDGAILTSASDVVIHSTTGKGYSWGGPEFPHNVAPEIDPTSAPLYVDRSDEVGGGGSSDAATVAYTHAGVAAAVQTTVANMLQSMRFNLEEFLSDELSISQSIKNMLTAANGAGCYIPDGVWTLTTPVAYTGTVKLLLGDNAVINYQGTWLTITDGDNSVISGGILTTPTNAYMVNRWNTSYNLVAEASYVYGINLDQGYQISGNDPEYADYSANHPERITYAATGIKLIRCDHSVVSFVRGKFVTLEFTDCEFSGAFRNNLHGGKDVYGSIAFRVAAKEYQRGNYAIQNIVRNNTHNGICWEGQLGFKCFQNQSMMSGESNFKRMQNTYVNVGCSVVDNDSHGAFYDGFDILTNYPPTGNVTNKRYYVINNRSSGNRNTCYALEGSVDFINNYALECDSYGVWAPYVAASRFDNMSVQNCNNATADGFAAVYINGSANHVRNAIIQDDAPINYALIMRGTNSTYSDVVFGSAYTNPLRIVGTEIHGVGNRGVKSSAGVSYDNYGLTDFSSLDETSTAVGIGFLIRSGSNKRAGKITTRLTVPSADNMYSEMLFSIRKDGSDASALTLASPDAEGHTYALLGMNIDGTGTVRRVKVGAPGTGPGGAGRMLYVDE